MPYRTFGIDEVARRFDAGQNEGIGDGAALHQIHGAAECALQRLCEAEELLQRPLTAVAIELDEEIGGAGF